VKWSGLAATVGAVLAPVVTAASTTPPAPKPTRSSRWKDPWIYWNQTEVNRERKGERMDYFTPGGARRALDRRRAPRR
jgi:hypothetical protein